MNTEFRGIFWTFTTFPVKGVFIRFTFHQKEIKGEKFNKLVIKMKNQIQKINKEDNPLLFEMESKLDLIEKGQ